MYGYGILLLIGAVISLFLGLVFSSEIRWSWGTEKTVFATLTTIFLIVGILCIGTLVYQGYHGNITVVTQDTPLVAFNNSFGVSGSFFLGSGIINCTDVYRYIYRPDPSIKNRFKVGDINANLAVVIEDSSIQPTLRWVRRYKKWGLMDIREWEFYIPPGSVKQMYSVDVSNHTD